MSLRQRVEDELRGAMKAMASGGDPLKLETCRMLKSAVKYREIELGQPLDDAGVMAVVGSLIKQRRDSVEQYRAGGRPDAAAKEEAEIVILQAFLPTQLGEAELGKLVDEAIAETGAKGPKDMGQVMKVLKVKAAGRAEGKTLSELVKARLSGSA
ncbi:MAG TPA: GatB/YqeY domain-containing protein [Myxococcales bacterium]|nr:GatB/YqeY domain-containing protein [Myxococcales bacterium]